MNFTPALPSIIGTRYRVLKELGRGGFGAVYLVEHLNTGDRHALKVLYGAAARDPMSIERFKREARAAAKIRSENVVKVIDADSAEELDGAPFLVMELLQGNDLEKHLETRGAFAPSEVVALLVQVARALDRAHSLGIIHRDLKPENLFLHAREDGSEILKILDFGISKMMGDAGGEGAGVGVTSTGALLGTPLYMSPEQARGAIQLIGPGTDVWSVGLIAYRLLSGEIFWRANTIADLMVDILVKEMPRPSTMSARIPPAFDAWFLRSCDRDPAARFATVGEQIAALGLALASMHDTQAMPGPAPSSPFLPSMPFVPVVTARPAAVGMTTGAPTLMPPAAVGAKASTAQRAAAVLAATLVFLAASAFTLVRHFHNTKAIGATSPEAAAAPVSAPITAPDAAAPALAVAESAVPTPSLKPAVTARRPVPAAVPGATPVHPVSTPPSARRFDPDSP